MEPITLIAALSGLIGAIASIFGEIISEKRKSKKESVEERINRLTSSLRESSELIGKIESEIQERSALVQKLKSDAETYNEIVKLKESEVEAVAQLLRGELKKEGKRSFWQGVAVNFVFFVLGVIASIVLGLLLK